MIPWKCDYRTHTHTRTHRRTDRQTDAGQSNPYVPLCFTGDTNTPEAGEDGIMLLRNRTFVWYGSWYCHVFFVKGNVQLTIPQVLNWCIHLRFKTIVEMYRMLKGASRVSHSFVKTGMRKNGKYDKKTVMTWGNHHFLTNNVNDLYDKKQPTNKLKVRILSETSISIWFVTLQSFKTYMLTSQQCWKKNSDAQSARTSNLWITGLTRSQLNYIGRYVEWELIFYCTVLYSYNVTPHCITTR